mgnify:CR=1 FL=1
MVWALCCISSSSFFCLFQCIRKYTDSEPIPYLLKELVFMNVTHVRIFETFNSALAKAQ